MDVLDVAIIAYLVYKILCLVRSTRAENILKGVAIFLVALWLSSPAALNLRGVNYILSHMVEWGRSGPDHPCSSRRSASCWRRWAAGTSACCAFSFQPEQQYTELERAIDQTVAACTDMAKTRTGGADRVRAEAAAGRIVRSGTTLDAAVSSELLKRTSSS